MSVAIQWFENPAFDAPELKSPQPCIHGAGCVYTKKTADGKVVPGVCNFVHPGEEGRGRALFPARTIRFEHPDGQDLVDQPACVRLIGGALYYERMRMRMPWQGFCAVRGIPFTANTPGVYREPVKRVPIGSTSRSTSASSHESVKPRAIHHVRTAAGQDYLVSCGKMAPLSPEEAVRLGLRAPVSAVPTLDEGWPVLPVAHADVEKEVIAASASLGVVLPRSCACEGIWHGCGEGTYESDNGDDDTCNECGKLVELCLERGDHGDAHRWEAEQATW
jgi:hypothetical protein